MLINRHPSMPLDMRYPGDLLHEAGHLAVLPSEVRPQFGTDGIELGIDMTALEILAIAWSFAAARHLEIDPAVVFHEGGYHGHSPGLLRTFGVGVYVGVDGLEAAGLTATPRRAQELGVQPYPAMIRWLRK